MKCAVKIGYISWAAEHTNLNINQSKFQLINSCLLFC